MHQQESRFCVHDENVFQDRISALPNDLLIRILSEAPTKYAVTSMVLSKRWRFLWNMMPKLDYSHPDKTSMLEFLDKSFQLHKAPLLESLRIKLSENGPVDAAVRTCVSLAVARSVRELNLDLEVPYRHNQVLPACLYTSKTLVNLSLFNNILVDVPSPACLPSLQTLELNFVVYKDQDSHASLLSSCPVLKDLIVLRRDDDNMTGFSVRVPSLERLTFRDIDSRGLGRFLVIDSPGLRYLKIEDLVEYSCSIHDMPRLDVAFVNAYVSPLSCQHGFKFLTCFSSVMFLKLGWPKVPSCSAINFSRLIELKLSVDYRDTHWLESLVHLLHSSPKLQLLLIDSVFFQTLPHSWNQSSSVPACLLSQLEIFEWKGYRGRSAEKQFVAYILANSQGLKTVGVSPRCSYDSFGNIHDTKEMMMEELESMHRVSASSSQLMFSPQLQWRSYRG